MISIMASSRFCKAFYVVVLFVVSTLAHAQTPVNPDFAFSFDTPAEVNDWYLLYASETVVETPPQFDNGSLAFVPDWQAPHEFMGYVADLGGVFDFTRAYIVADVKFSSAYYATTASGDPEYLANSALILVDTAGRKARTRVWGPQEGIADTFAHHVYMDGEVSLDVFDTGFDITQVEKFGVNLQSAGRLPASPGVIAYDNIFIGLGNVTGLPTDNDMVYLPVNPNRWTSVLSELGAAQWNGSTGSYTVWYDNTDTAGNNEEIDYHFVWHPEMTNSRLAFRLFLPSSFAGLATGVEVQLVDNIGRVAVLVDLPSEALLFDEPMVVNKRRVSRKTMVRSDHRFNISNVQALRLVVGLPSETHTVDGQLRVDRLSFQVLKRFAKNRVNTRLPTRRTGADLALGIYLSEWFEDYVPLHLVVSRDPIFSLATDWQSNEAKLVFENALDQPVNITGLELHQQVYLPAEALGSGMRMVMTVTDANGNTVILPVSDLSASESPGWTLVVVDNAMLTGLDLTIIESQTLAFIRENALGYVGEFQIKAPRFAGRE